MISLFFTTAFQVTRMSWSNDSSAEVSQGSFNGHIQQLDDKDLVQSLGLNFTKAHKIWCAVDEDVEEGDTLTSGSDIYSVKMVIKMDIGNNPHLEIIVQKHVNNS